MPYMPSSEDLSILKYRSAKLFCQIVLLNDDMIEIDELTGVVTDGSISIDADSDIRRTFTSTIKINEKDSVATGGIDTLACDGCET